MLEKIWVEKYRPKKIKAVVGNEQLKKTFEKYLEKGEIPNVLLYGPPGTGKTTISKILIKTLDCEYLFLNGSDENGIDVIRNKIGTFVSSVTFDKKFKIVFIDECLDKYTKVCVLREGKKQYVEIKDLLPDTDLVKSYDFNRDVILWQPFELIDNGEKDTYLLEFENDESVICTENHKWYVFDKKSNEVKVVSTKEINEYMEIITI